MREQFYDFDIYDIPETLNEISNVNSEQNLLVLARAQDFNEHKELLLKILSAIGYAEDKNAKILTLEDEAPINLSRSVPTSISYVICFGLMPKDIGFNASFRPNHFYQSENFSVLLSYKLEKLGTNVDNKKALWGALQSVFKK